MRAPVLFALIVTLAAGGGFGWALHGVVGPAAVGVRVAPQISGATPAALTTAPGPRSPACSWRI